MTRVEIWAGMALCSLSISSAAAQSLPTFERDQRQVLSVPEYPRLQVFDRTQRFPGPLTKTAAMSGKWRQRASYRNATWEGQRIPELLSALSIERKRPACTG